MLKERCPHSFCISRHAARATEEDWEELKGEEEEGDDGKLLGNDWSLCAQCHFFARFLLAMFVKQKMRDSQLSRTETESISFNERLSFVFIFCFLIYES